MAVLTALLVVILPNASRAQTIYSEDFTGGTTNNSWYFTGGACLTAGTSTSITQPGTIPSCVSIFSSYYAVPRGGGSGMHSDVALVGGANGVAGAKQTLPDPAGQGALRFTNGFISGVDNGYYERGAIWSDTVFNAGQGLQITFKTVTYRGNSAGSGADGADGMSFYLIDATTLKPGDGFFNGTGSIGGSLGYSCSNSNAPSDGVAGGYLGVGIDEYGNFLNGAALLPGTPSGQTQSYGGNDYQGDTTAFGYGHYGDGRIGLRGAGNITWAALHSAYPYYYNSNVLNTSALQQSAVQNTCTTGLVLDYSTTFNPACNLYNPPTTYTKSTPYCPNIVTTAQLQAKKYSTTPLLDYAPVPLNPSGNPVGWVNITRPFLLANEAALARPTGKTTRGVTNGDVLVFNLKITQDGLLTFSYSANGGASQAVITNQSIAAANGSLPARLRFGFAGSTGGGNNIHEIMCFQAAPVSQSASSAGGDQQQTAAVQTTSQEYFAYYNPNDWTGRVTAYGLVDTAGMVTVAPVANWDAQCGLSGDTNCLNTGGGPTTLQAPASRVMLTLNGTNTDKTTHLGTVGVPFEWTKGITSVEQGTLGAATRLDYLRGGTSNEIQPSGSGLYRARNGILGDIVDSSPAWVGPPGSPYSVTWRDRLNPGTAMPENAVVGSYSKFQAANQSRLNVVYVGANDGFLHGFRSGSEDSSGNVIDSATTPNDGYEVLAYMPGAVLNTVHSNTVGLDLSNTQYQHNFFVDATPGTGDLFYGGAWHTWLVGGLGAGGAAIYALDITSPGNFTENNSAGVVLGELTAATINCAGNSGCGTNLGKTYGTPQIRRFHNGMWGAVFGNGYGSSSGDAGIYVMTLDPSTFAFTVYYLSTGTASKTNPNGIGYVTPVDLDSDHITDYVYAGDLRGNVWRFDLTSTSATSWAVTSGEPLFTTQSGQPITTQLVAASSLVAGVPRVILAFGTGQRTQFTNTSATSYVSGTQTLYGVWDWNLSAWNAASTADYASLTTAQYSVATGDNNSPYTLGISKLQPQTLTASPSGVVTTTNYPVLWAQCTTSTSCTPGGLFGWYANLPGSNVSGSSATTEQIVSSPSLYQGAFIVNSTIPANNDPLSCAAAGTDDGVLYALAATTGGTFLGGGGAPSNTYSSVFTSKINTQTVGLPSNETGTVTVANTAEGTTFLIGQNIAVSAGQVPGQAIQVLLPNNTTVNRITWVELR